MKFRKLVYTMLSTSIIDGIFIILGIFLFIMNESSIFKSISIMVILLSLANIYQQYKNKKRSSQ